MIRVHTLGTASIDVREHRFTPSSAKRFGFLLYLAAAPARRHPRSVLHSVFFPDVTEKQAKHGIRELVYQLRQSGGVFNTDFDGVQVSSADVWRDWDDALVDKRMDDATIRMIEGGFLPGYAPDISEEYSTWLDGFRAALVSDLAHALLREVDRAKVDANWKRVAHAARACLAIDPLNGNATVALAKMLAIGGSATKAAELLASYKADMSADARELSVSVKGLGQRIAEIATDPKVGTVAQRFAGREAEMAILSDALGNATRGGARVVIVSGEPGIGKSRLLSEFGSYAVLEGGATISTSAHPHDTGMPLTVIRNLSKTLLGRPGALGCSPASMEWVRRLIRPEGAGSSSTSGDQTSAAISSAVVDLINAVSAETPLAIVVDDSQWADRASLELLQSIAVSPATKHVLIVLGTRQANHIFEAGYWGSQFAIVELAPLTIPVAAELLTEQLGDGDTEHRALIDWMVELAAGNPFFIETVAAHFRSTNERFSVPHELNAVVDQRIGALTADARDVLEAVVALGRHATIARLEQVMAAMGPLIVRATRELEQRRLISVSDRVVPAHWLIAESIERHASPIARRLLYRRISMILESEISSSSDSSAFLDCAETWVVADEPGRAAELIAECARRCLDLGRAREAAALFLRAAGLANGARRAQLATTAIQIANAAGESTLTIQAAGLLPAGLQRGHDSVELAVLSAQARLDVNLERTLQSLTQCIAAESAGTSHRLSAAIALLVFYDQNRQVEQIRSVEPLLLGLLSQGTDDESKRFQCALIYHATFGDLAQVPHICKELLAIAAVARVDVACDLMRKASVGLYRCGHVEQSVRALEGCHALAANNGLVRIADSAALMLASHLLDARPTDNALKWFNVVLAVAPGVHDDYWEFSRLTVEAEFAMWRRDATALFRLSQLARRFLGDRQTAGARRLYNSTRLAALHMTGGDIDPDDAVRELTQHHIPGYELGEMSDREIAIATAIAYKHRGDCAARRILLDYLERVRRPGVPASIALANESFMLAVDARAILEARRHAVVGEDPAS